MTLEEALDSRDLANVAEALRRDPSAVHVVGEYARTALSWAIGVFPEAVPLLIEAGADVNGIAVAKAAEGTQIVFPRPLVSVADLEHTTREEAQTAIGVVAALLRAGADPDLPNGRGEAALHRAAYATPSMSPGSEQIVTLLLEYGADPNLLDPWKHTPLDLACMVGNGPVVRLLLQAGGRLSSLIEKPEVALAAELILALLAGDTKTVEATLASTKDAVDFRAEHGQTALHVAAWIGDVDMVRLLLAHGADIRACHNVWDIRGKWHLRRGGTPLHRAAFAGHPEVIAVLIDAGADPNEVGAWPRGNTPLIEASLAAKFNQRDPAEALQAMKLLIDRGADVHAQSRSGPDGRPFTALKYAAWLGFSVGITLLLEAGAVQKRGHLYEAIHVSLPEYDALPQLWAAGQTLLNPPLTLAEVVPLIDGRGIRHLREACAAEGLRIDIDAPDPCTGETARQRVRQRVGRNRDIWGHRKYVYEEEDVALLLPYRDGQPALGLA